MWLDLSGSAFHKYNLLPRKHIVPEQRLFITKQDDKTGINYTTTPYDRYVLSAGKNNSLGLILSVVPWVLLKRGDINDWSTFLEVFAAPFRKGKYPQYNEKAKEALAQACSSIGSMSWAIIPNETDLELIQSQATGSTTAYREFAEFCDKQVSKAFLHNTMTTDAEGGKYKGDIHEQSESGVLKSDIQFVVSVLNDKLLPLLEMHGFAPGKGKFSVVDEEHLCIKDRIGVDVQLNSIIDIPAEYFYKRYNIPVPKGGAKKIEQTKISLTGQSSYNSVEIPDKKRNIIDTVKDFFV